MNSQASHREQSQTHDDLTREHSAGGHDTRRPWCALCVTEAEVKAEPETSLLKLARRAGYASDVPAKARKHSVKRCMASNGQQYVEVISGTSGRLYTVRLDGTELVCTCAHSEHRTTRKTWQPCSHIVAAALNL